MHVPLLAFVGAVGPARSINFSTEIFARQVHKCLHPRLLHQLTNSDILIQPSLKPSVSFLFMMECSFADQQSLQTNLCLMPFAVSKLERDRQPIFVKYIFSVPNERASLMNILTRNSFADSALELFKSKMFFNNGVLTIDPFQKGWQRSTYATSHDDNTDVRKGRP